MRAEAFLAYVGQFLQIAALVSVLWAAYSFIRSQREQRKQAREVKLANWRKATVQQLLHRSQTFMSAADITSSLRSSSFDTDFQIRKAELDERGVRLLLIEMIEAGVIKQLWGDTYGISHFDPAAEVQERTATAIRVGRRAFDHMYEAPGAYTTKKLHAKITEELAIRVAESDFQLMLNELIRQGAACQDGRGRWHPKGGPTDPYRFTQGDLLDAPSSLP